MKNVGTSSYEQDDVEYFPDFVDAMLETMKKTKKDNVDAKDRTYDNEVTNKCN